MLLGNDELARHGRLLFTIAAVTIIAAFGFGWFSQIDGTGRSFILGLVGMLAVPLLGLCLVAIFLFVLIPAGIRLAWSEEGGRAHFARGNAPVILVALVCAAVPLVSLGGELRLRYLLRQNETVFEQFVASRDPSRGGIELSSGGTAYPALDGDFAYFKLAGMADNSQGFIHDPSGQVALASGWDDKPGRFTAPEHVRRIFGGDLLACRHVRGHFYYCSFT